MAADGIGISEAVFSRLDLRNYQSPVAICVAARTSFRIKGGDIPFNLTLKFKHRSQADVAID